MSNLGRPIAGAMLALGVLLGLRRVANRPPVFPCVVVALSERMLFQVPGYGQTRFRAADNIRGQAKTGDQA